MENPLVSICCICYNQELYIRQTLDGFVMQQTNFPFEIVISDDCSSDATRMIIAEYKANSPILIRDISPKENLGVAKNFVYSQKNAYGKYIAVCEGDDFWIDPYKLQKQVDFMESHPMCCCCSHNSLRYNTLTNTISSFSLSMRKQLDYSLEDFLQQGWFTPTQSLLFRKDCLMEDYGDRLFMHGDYNLLLSLLLKSGSYLHYDNQIMGVYRDGGWASTNYDAEKLHEDFLSLLRYFKERSNHQCDKVFDNMIKKEEDVYAGEKNIQYLQIKSRSLWVRMMHWASRFFAYLGNLYVDCLTVEKRV